MANAIRLAEDRATTLPAAAIVEVVRPRPLIAVSTFPDPRTGLAGLHRARRSRRLRPEGLRL
jgi:hypothetical protein